MPRPQALALVVAVLTLPFRALADPPPLEVETVVSVAAPVHVTHAGDARLFIVERQGRILIHTPAGGLEPAPFLDIADLVDTSGEGGLLSAAFHPDFATNGAFYVYYTRSSAPLNTVVARYTVSAGNPDLADPESASLLLDLAQPFLTHNGGQLQFGPRDGHLYVALGDGGMSGDPGCRAQRTDTLLGKLLRLDVNQSFDAPPFHGIPDDNPFGGPGEPLAEVWATGLRNPWRFSFDREIGDMWIGDVGQNSWEEVDRQPANSPGGENYVWKVQEGFACFNPDPIDADCPVQTPSCSDPAYTDPLFVYANTGFGGNCAVTGGYVYRGMEIPALAGAYVFGDYCSGAVWALEPAGDGWERIDLLNVGFGLTSFGEDAEGELYLTVGGDVLRLTTRFRSKAQRACSVALWQDFGRVHRAASIDIKKCLRDGSANRLEGSIEACTASDRANRIARAEQKTVDRAARRCSVPPHLGPDDPAVVNAAARRAPIDLLHGMLGPDLDAATADARAESVRWKCQNEIVRGLSRCANTRVREFARCAKADLADRLPDTQQTLAACLAADPRGRVAGACDAVTGWIAARALPRRCVAKGRCHHPGHRWRCTSWYPIA